MNQLIPTNTSSKPVQYIDFDEKERLKKGVTIWLNNVMVSRNKNKLFPTHRQRQIHDRDQLLIEWIWHTGMRISDALSIKFGDIDNAKEIVSFIIKKRSRKTPFLHHISLSKPMLFEVQRYKDTYLLKTDMRLFPITRAAAWENLDKYAELAGFPLTKRSYTTRSGVVVPTESYFHPHILRHSMCMNDVLTGIPIQVTSYRAGHKSIDTTVQVYQRMNPTIEKQIRGH